MTDIKYVIQSQNGSELFDVDKGILNRACWFTGPRIVELKVGITHLHKVIYPVVFMEIIFEIQNHCGFVGDNLSNPFVRHLILRKNLMITWSRVVKQ